MRWRAGREPPLASQALAGVRVLDVAYLLPGDSVADGITGYDKIPMKGQSLIAVGAGHIIGSDGLVAQFRARGYRVERVR